MAEIIPVLDLIANYLKKEELKNVIAEIDWLMDHYNVNIHMLARFNKDHECERMD